MVQQLNLICIAHLPVNSVGLHGPKWFDKINVWNAYIYCKTRHDQWIYGTGIHWETKRNWRMTRVGDGTRWNDCIACGSTILEWRIKMWRIRRWPASCTWSTGPGHRVRHSTDTWPPSSSPSTDPSAICQLRFPPPCATTKFPSVHTYTGRLKGRGKGALDSGRY